MAHVLIVVLVFSHGYSSSSISQEFYNLDSCESALEEIQETFRSSQLIYAACVPK